MPTALSLLGLGRPQRVEGMDLRECLEGKPVARAGNRDGQECPSYASYFESLQPAVFDCCPLQGVVEGRWKYIRGRNCTDLAPTPAKAKTSP